MPERTLTVRIVGDDADLRRAFSRSEKGAKQMSLRLEGIAGGVARGFLAVTAGVATFETLTQVIGASVDEASGLNEEISKSRQIFGASSAEIERWAETTADALGISNRAALEATGTYGNLFRSMGFAEQEAADMSRRLVVLAADLVSFNNANPEDVLLAIRSGLIGEAEPLRRFGARLSETRVQMVALATTGKTNVKNLTEQEKALARLDIIFQDTAKAQGDMARTQDSFANQSKRLKANLEDLSAEIGGVLVPVLSDATELALLLFDALDKFRGVDFSPGFDFPDPPSWLSGLALAPISPAGAIALTAKKIADEIRGANEDIEDALRPDDRPGPRGPGAIDFTNEILAAEERDRQAKQLAAALKKGRERFAAFVKGQGLRLSRAELTATLDDDLDALRDLERAIRRRIRIEGETFELAQALVDVRLQKSALVEDRAARAQDASQRAFDNLLGALTLQFDRARIRAGFEDDLRALEAIENAIRERIAIEGRTLELERQLFDVQQQQRDVRAERREAAAAAVEAEQFRRLGLTAEGEERAPGRRALQRRQQALQERIKGTVLDTDATRATLRRIGRVLGDETRKLGRDVSLKIKDMLDEIADAFDEGDVAFTKFQKVGTRMLTEGLGLSPEARRELRFRLSQVGRGGTIPQETHFGGGGGGAVVVAGDVNVNVQGGDPDAVMRAVQNKVRRRAATRTGRRRGSRSGLDS